MTADTIVEARDASSSSARLLALVLVALPILVNAIALFPEVRNRAPSDNDQIFHYLFIERADQAVAAGDNPVDHWLPQLELGFPQFQYYQNLPHLTVVAIHHLLLERISLLTVLNVLRYLLMVLFPLTVYWSMRRMEFSVIAAGVGAAFASTLSSARTYGFDYRSYVWAGLGMFPQLCSMHLMFIGLACLREVLERGRGYAAAIISSATMVLSDLLYGYIFALSAAVLCLLSIAKQAAGAEGPADGAARISRPIARLAIVAIAAGAIAAYQIAPFLLEIQYLNQISPELPPRFFSMRMVGHAVMSSLIGGAGYDRGRLPVTITLVLLGILHGAIIRSRAAKLALAFMASFIFLILGPTFVSPLVNLIPLWKLLPLARLISGRDFAAILLAGLGGEFIWRLPLPSARVRVAAASAILLTFCIIALAERWDFYRSSTGGMELTAAALAEDTDLAQIIAALKKAPPGRVYAGTRGNWGNWMSIGRDHLYDLLPDEQFDTLMPWQTLSLNSLYLWGLNIPDSKLCTLFNIRYIVAPPQLRVPQSYRLQLSNNRYNLYEVDSGGYMELGRVARVLPMAGGSKFMVRNQKWIASGEPAQGRFIAYRPSNGDDSDLAAAVTPATTGAPDPTPPGTIEREAITPDSMSAQVTATTAALLVMKISYHPNWHVMVDGREQPTFMVSPSFIGVMLAPGQHQVSAEYRSSRLKKALMVLGGLTLLVTLGMWIFGLESRGISARPFGD